MFHFSYEVNLLISFRDAWYYWSWSRKRHVVLIKVKKRQLYFCFWVIYCKSKCLETKWNLGLVYLHSFQLLTWLRRVIVTWTCYIFMASFLFSSFSISSNLFLVCHAIGDNYNSCNFLIFLLLIILQIGKIGSTRMEQGSAWESRMEAYHLHLAACRCYSSACKHVELGFYWNTPWTTIWI